MDISSIALGAVASQQAQTRAAISASIIKQAHAQETAFAEMIAQQAEAGQALASALPPGTGANIDIRV